MTLPGETISTGASQICHDCGEEIELKVCHSNAGYYIGGWCMCGPYCRESGYYPTREQAEKDLKSGEYERRS